MDRRTFLKAAALPLVAAIPALAEYDGPDIWVHPGPDWLWTGKLNLQTRYWRIDGLHRPSGARWAWLLPETYLANRGISIESYLLERPAMHNAYAQTVMLA
jgi:hypothetical protein